MSRNPTQPPESPAEAWLTRTLPLRRGFCAEIGADLRSHTPTGVAYCLSCDCFLGLDGSR
jgi:hypothetical protein